MSRNTRPYINKVSLLDEERSVQNLPRFFTWLVQILDRTYEDLFHTNTASSGKHEYHCRIIQNSVHCRQRQAIKKVALRKGKHLHKLILHI